MRLLHRASRQLPRLAHSLPDREHSFNTEHIDIKLFGNEETGAKDRIRKTMAHLYYGADGAPIKIPEALLAHIKVVITTKLRRGESFMMTWRHDDGAGRSSIWLQASIPMRFVFDDPEPAELDRELLAHLAESANSNGGLSFTLPGPSTADADRDSLEDREREVTMA